MTIRTASSLSLLASAAIGSAESALIEGPFVPGTGAYTIANRGDFEAADSAAFWSHNATPGVTGQRLQAAAMNSDWGYKMTYPNASLSPDQIYGTGQIHFGLQVGQRYVLSCFLRADEGTGSLIVWGEQGGTPSFGIIDMTSDNQSRWYFGWSDFVAQSDRINIRLGRRGHFPAFATNYFDDIAITRHDDFEPPATVPEPATLISVIIGFAISVRRTRRAR